MSEAQTRQLVATFHIGRSGSTVFVCVEAKFFHLHDHGIALETFLTELSRETPCHFVVRRRKNYLRKIVSSLAARQRDPLVAYRKACVHLGLPEGSPEVR